jgi:signal transduction histidine kinase
MLRTLLKEREQLMQDLHDGLIQSLYAVGMSVDECRRLTEEDPPKAGIKLGQAVDDINRVIREVRQHLAQGEDDLPFSAHRLKTELARVAATMERANALHFRLKVDARAAECLTSEERKEILYIAQETMSNCLRHSGAKVANVSLRLGRDRVFLEVEDDGKGFEKRVLLETNGGLRNIERRAEKVRAKMEIVSQREHGTRIRLSVPIHYESESQP